MVYTLYIKSKCPHSEAAVKSAKLSKERCQIVDILKIPNCSIAKVVAKLKTHKFLSNSITHNTVPIVFHNGKYIGGNQEFQVYLNKL